VAALSAPALRGPVDETLQLVPMFPGKLEEFPGVEMRGFLAQKSFHAPL